MKKLVLFIAGGALALLLTAGCAEKSAARSPEGGTIYRHHFLGGVEIHKLTNAARFKKVLNQETSGPLLEQVVEKLSAAPKKFWKKQLPGNASDEAALLKPLWQDFFKYESIVEVKGPIGSPDAILLVNVPGERSGLWNTNLSKTLTSWKFGGTKPFAIGESKGWETSKDGQNIQFVQAGKWVALRIGPGGSTNFESMVKEIAKSGRPSATLKTNILEWDADLPRLSAWFPVLKKYNFPRAQFEISPRGDDLRTEGRFTYNENLGWKFEPWNLPTNMINDPLVSFTAAQGVKPILAATPDFQLLGLKTVPNQFCSWAQALNPWLSFLTVPMPNASNVVRQAAANIPKLVQRHISDTNAVGILYASNRAEIMLRGLPINPYVRAVRGPSGDFLFAGLFPPGPKTNPPPPELYGQFMGKTNVAYYHWELTSDRLLQAKLYYQLYYMANRLQLPSPTTAPTQKWLADVATNLIEVVTEVTVAGPKELAMTRKSQTGLSGFELATLAAWIESPDFPLDFQAPPKREIAHPMMGPNGKPILRSSNAPPPGIGAPKSSPPPKQ